MSTPNVPPQPNHDPQAVPPASGAGPSPFAPPFPGAGAPGYGEGAPGYGTPSPYAPPGPYAAPGQYPASGQYATPAQYATPGQYPAPGLYGMAVPPPAKNRKLLWIILGVVGAVLALIVVGVIVLVNVVGNATNRVQAVSDDFTRLIVNGQSEQAYDKYVNPALAQSLPKAKFVAGVAGLQLNNSCKPHYDSVMVNSVNGTNTADVAGTLQCEGKNVQFRYGFVGNDLKLNAIRLEPQG
ncbi:hypothetical protein [Arthrobacter sp. MMS24-S77]